MLGRWEPKWATACQVKYKQIDAGHKGLRSRSALDDKLSSTYNHRPIRGYVARTATGTSGAKMTVSQHPPWHTGFSMPFIWSDGAIGSATDLSHIELSSEGQYFDVAPVISRLGIRLPLGPPLKCS